MRSTLKIMMVRCLTMFVTVGMVAAPVALAQTAPKPDCEAAAPAKSPTETAKGPDSGTKNMGSTGWSGGGMGGSRNDTTDAGPTTGSKTEHPATAKGLDPTKPESAPRQPC